jgi:predicted small lipoprotein YifL
MYHMSDKINHAHSKKLLFIFAIPLMILVSSCGNKGPLTVPEDRMEAPAEQQETTSNSY